MNDFINLIMFDVHAITLDIKYIYIYIHCSPFDLSPQTNNGRYIFQVFKAWDLFIFEILENNPKSMFFLLIEAMQNAFCSHTDKHKVTLSSNWLSRNSELYYFHFLIQGFSYLFLEHICLLHRSFLCVFSLS